MCSCYLCVSALKLRSLRINERERERARALNLNITRNPETILCAFTETFNALTSATPSGRVLRGLSATSCASPVIMLLCSATMCTRVSCHKARRRHDARSPATMSCLLSPSTMRSRSTSPVCFHHLLGHLHLDLKEASHLGQETCRKSCQVSVHVPGVRPCVHEREASIKAATSFRRPMLMCRSV